ncbi:cell division protein ZipA [Marinomonas agarivorans]|nr:cell division protein ZipA [Marinomonas agarivorans]
MDFSLREWLIIIGIVIIFIILIDGFRRYRSAQKLAESDDLDPDLLLKEAMVRRELPSGQARVMVHEPDPVKNAFENAKSSVDARLTELPHEMTIGPHFEQKDDLQLDELAALIPEQEIENQNEPDALLSLNNETAFETPYEEEEFERQYSSADIEQDTPLGTVQEKEEPQEDIEEVIVINVFATAEKPFMGMELLQLVLNCGMRYGDMNIFHRHEEGFDRGRVQFSMANAIEPGTFDLDTIGENTSSGVSFFMGLPGPKNSMKAFDFMLETAQSLVRNLDGELRDERRALMSEQTIEHCRQRIRDFERRRLMRAKK